MWELLQKIMGSGAAAGAAGAPGAAPGGILGALFGGGGAPAQGAPVPPAAAPAPAATAAPQGILGMLGGKIGAERGGQLMDMGAAMMKAGAPSLNPASGSFMGALGDGFGAYGASGRTAADTALKKSLTDAQIGNYKSSIEQNNAQTALVQGQAKAMSEGMPAMPSNPMLSAPGNATPVGGTATAAVTSAPPAAGEVFDGYRFKGGNPNDPTAWEKV